MSKKKQTTDETIVKMLKDQLDRMETKIDKLDDRLDSAEKVAIKQEANLEAHMKRSDLLEQSQNDLKDSVKPLLKIYTVAWGITKIVLAVGVVVSILGGIAKLMGLL